MAVTVREAGHETGGERKRDIQFMHPGNATLRRAIQENIVSFPSQVPVLSKQPRPDVQRRVVMLYFLHGWTMSGIGRRYGFSDFRISQILNEWAVRAFALGYIQVIDDERFPDLSRLPSEGPDKVRPSHAAAMPAVPARLITEPTTMQDRPTWHQSRNELTLPASQPAIASPPPPDEDRVLVALDRAIETCTNRSGEFWFHTVAALRALRVAIAAGQRGFEADAGRIVAEPLLTAGALAASAAASTGRHLQQGVI
jgi:hypothetical protein